MESIMHHKRKRIYATELTLCKSTYNSITKILKLQNDLCIITPLYSRSVINLTHYTSKKWPLMTLLNPQIH